MKKALIIIGITVLYASANLGLYLGLTQRLSNNYSGVNQLKMIDVSKFLPFEEESELARTGSTFHIEDDLPVLDGAAALVPIYASVIDQCYPEGCVTYEGGTFSDDNYYGENFADDSAMQYQNTVRGFNAVVDGSVDLFFTAHPSADQMAYAQEQGVELEIVPIGLESFVFFVNRNNPVEDLTVDQIRSIYRGEITNWSEVGGSNDVINPLLRIQGSGSQTMMEAFMQNDMITRRPMNAIFGKSIGYSFRYYLSSMVANENVRMLSVNGVYPSAENIRNGSYPITAQFYVVYRADNDNPNLRPLVEWLRSEEGQRLIEGCGYVGLPQE
ncbi:MAG: substrate-binding domain-containing protein [Clostridiales bacterium]|nr:substrate-binding domain-containing protein [Clostridiales bacterium]